MVTIAATRRVVFSKHKSDVIPSRFKTFHLTEDKVEFSIGLRSSCLIGSDLPQPHFSLVLFSRIHSTEFLLCSPTLRPPCFFWKNFPQIFDSFFSHYVFNHLRNHFLFWVFHQHSDPVHVQRLLKTLHCFPHGTIVIINMFKSSTGPLGAEFWKHCLTK